MKTTEIPILLALLLSFAWASTPSSAQSTSKKGVKPVQTSKAKEPPLIDRDLFFGNAEISDGQLSPDGRYISFMKAYNGIENVWVKRFDEPFENARPVTATTRPLYAYVWTRDSKYIVFAKDNDGDENVNIFAVAPSAPAGREGVPEARNLTPMKNVTAQIYVVSRNNPDHMYVALNDRDPAWHDLYRLSISSGRLEKLHENKDRATSYTFDWDDRLRMISKNDLKGNTTIHRVDEGGGLTPIYEYKVDEQANVYGWNDDNRRCYLVTNKGELDRSTCYLMDPSTGRLTFFEEDPKKRVDFGGIRFDDNTRRLVATQYTADKKEYLWKDRQWEELYGFLQKRFPGREVVFQSMTNDNSKMLIEVTGDRFASETWLLDAKRRKLILQYTPRPKLKAVEEHLAKMEPVSYRSSDGLSIPGYLTLPAGKAPRNLPLVVLVHGGPKGPRDNWGYNAEVQFLANRGYAVLQPNFRASGGYGKKFLNAGDRQWGRLMQDDITWGVKHLVDKGVADRKRVAIMGASYGGYATLAGLAFTPELYACGVDIVGPSNLFTLMESIPPYWESFRAYFNDMLGDPSTEEGKALMRQASPLFSVDRIEKPLLIVQGANDPRVKQAESDQIVAALRDKNKKVQYLLAKDEGHGFYKPLNLKAMYAETEKFLSEVIGGRHQKEMEEDVRKTLESLRVDIKSVRYEPAKPTEATSK